MLTQNAMNNAARWEVRWWNHKKRTMVRKTYDTDFALALERYHDLRSKGYTLVTLRCANVGFSPPARLIADEVETWEVVTRKGKRFKKKVITVVDHMEELNLEGKYWCPYCIKVLPFRQIDHYGETLMVCPLCDISSRDWHVKRWNPGAKTIEFRAQRVRTRVGDSTRQSKGTRRSGGSTRRAR